MNAKTAVAGILLLGAAVLTSAQTPERAKAATVHPALAALVAPRAADLRAAGIEKIVARTGRQAFDIHVVTGYGPAYFAWPRGAIPTPFEIDIGPGTALSVRADDYTEANNARYAAAFDAVLPEAVRLAEATRAYALRPRS